MRVPKLTSMQSEEFPLVSVVTLNWNTTAVTCEFLESSRLLTWPNYEILVCDMHSDQDPTAAIEAGNYPFVKLLRSDQNLGFSGGNNWGIRQARGEYIFIVNNDTELNPSIITDLLKPFATDDSIGVVCPKILYFFQPGVIQYAGFNPISKLTGRTTAIGSHEPDHGQYNEGRYTAGAHGCAMMVSRAVIDQTGMFPENFFLYYEEWDWSSRILNAGYKIWYEPSAFILHKESASVGKQSPLKVYYQTRNRILYMRRNSGRGELAVFTAFFTLFSIPKSIITYLIKGKFTHLKAFVKGFSWNLYSSSRSVIR